MLQERDQRRRDAHHLFGRHIHVRHAVDALDQELVIHPHRHALGQELPLVVQRRVGLSDDIVLFLVRREVLHLVSDVGLHAEFLVV